MKINNPDNMNFFLTDIPDRTKQPRDYGLTMMMDKGLSFNQAKEFIEAVVNTHHDFLGNQR